MDYAKIFPVSRKDEYKQNDIIDFELNFEGKALREKTISIGGVFKVVEVAGGAVLNSRDYMIDSAIGVSSAFRTITSSCDKLGTVETLSDYPVIKKASILASSLPEERALETIHTMEGVVNDDAVTNRLLNADTKIPFSVKPIICFNNSVGPVSYAKTGQIRISLQLNTNSNVIFGNPANPLEYIIEDIFLLAEVVPVAKEGGALVMKTRHNLSYAVESNNLNLQMNSPLNCIGFHASYLNQANRANNENTYDFTSPEVRRVEYSWNDVLSGLVSFPIETREEILYNSLKLFGNDHDNEYETRLDLQLLGLSFEEIQLKTRALTLNLEQELNGVNYDLIVTFICLMKI